MPHWVCGTHAGGPNRGFGEAPFGATKRCTGWARMHADGSTGSAGRAPYGATKRCTGRVKMQNWVFRGACGP
eukprot:2653612-Pyramimonas_sp.AAC.1